MNEPLDEPVDLSELDEDSTVRAGRIAARVSERVAESRRHSRSGLAMADAVQRRLSRVAIPFALAAAASLVAVIATLEPPRTEPDPFALVVMDGAAPASWVVNAREPRVRELLQLLGGGR